MYRFLAWFDEGSPATESRREAALSRWRDGLASLPSTWARFEIVEDGWGVCVAHAPTGGWHWDLVHDDGDLVALSLGIPIGLPDVTPAGAARRALDGELDLIDASPPYGLIAVARAEARFVVQQDWLGMCRIFERRVDGALA